MEGMEMGRVKRDAITTLDLVITVLMEHEKKLDELVTRIENITNNLFTLFDRLDKIVWDLEEKEENGST